MAIGIPASTARCRRSANCRAVQSSRAMLGTGPALITVLNDPLPAAMPIRAGTASRPDRLQRRAEHVDQLGSRARDDDAVDRPAERDLGCGGQAAAQVHDLLAQPAVLGPLLEAEDRVPQQPDRLVKLVDGGLDPLLHLPVGRPGGGTLQGEPGREHSLDHLVPKVGGDAVPVGQDGQFPQAALQLRAPVMRPVNPVPEPVRGHRDQGAEQRKEDHPAGDDRSSRPSPASPR